MSGMIFLHNVWKAKGFLKLTNFKIKMGFLVWVLWEYLQFKSGKESPFFRITKIMHQEKAL